MKAYEIYVVRQMIRLYAKEKSAAEVARKLLMPKADVLSVLSWAWERQEQVKHPPHRGVGVAEITAVEYLRYLYEHNVSAEDAAAAVCWSPERVMSTCGGRNQWSKKSGRRRLSVQQPDPEYVLGDPPAHVLEQELEKLREDWPANRLSVPPQHYEIPQGVDLKLTNFK